MILLYNPRATEFKYRLPISVLSLAAVFDGKYEWRIVDGNIDPDAGDTLLAMLERDPGIKYLLVTVMPGPQLTHAVPHTRAVKARFPHVTLVWGGYFPSSHADVVLREPSIDYAVRSQGENTILELLDTLENGGSPAGVDGLSYREGGEIRHNRARKLADPNDFPVLPYEKANVPRYLKNTILGNRTISYHSSIGCPFTCSFCSVTKNYAGRWLAEKPERTIETVRYLHDRFGVNGIEFHDSNFFTAEKRVAAFAEGINGLGIGWWGEGTIDTIMRYDDRTWELMRDSGCRMIFMGAENASATTLKFMSKGPLTPETTVAMAEKSRRYGIIPEFSFVLGNPPDPEADIEENIEFIYKLKQINPASEIILYLYTPTPGGAMYDEAVKMGFKYPDTVDEWLSPEWASFSRRRNPHTPWVKKEHLEKLNNFETVLNARYPTASDLKIRPWHRTVLQTLGSWRYRLRMYDNPLELRAFFKFISYTRPEQAGL
ncbi:MAG TPA: radical SAM protein [Chloroflexia bacterium]|nr:radical SAM protein [Chloroflexia bacterium]